MVALSQIWKIFQPIQYKEERIMITVAYIGFGVSVREYHIPYAEKMENVRIKYVMRREEDIPQFEG